MAARFPKDYQKVFKDNYDSIDNIPIIDLGNRCGHSDYVDFIDTKEMKSPVMRFVDGYQRPGIVLHLVCKLVGKENVEVTLALFQRYTDNADCWTYGWGHSNNTMYHIAGNYWEKNQDTYEYPFSGSKISAKLIEAILSGTDPVMKLAEQASNAVF